MQLWISSTQSWCGILRLLFKFCGEHVPGTFQGKTYSAQPCQNSGAVTLNDKKERLPLLYMYPSTVSCGHFRAANWTRTSVLLKLRHRTAITSPVHRPTAPSYHVWYTSIALLLKIAEPSDSDLTGPKCREGYASNLKMSTAPQQNQSDRLAEILPRDHVTGDLAGRPLINILYDEIA